MYHPTRRNLQTNSLQQESVNSFSFGSSTFPVQQTQRSVEFKVAQAVANMGIRRGNRRESIIDTNFVSYKQLEIIRHCLDEIEEAFENSLVNDQREGRISQVQADKIHDIVQNWSLD